MIRFDLTTTKTMNYQRAFSKYYHVARTTWINSLVYWTDFIGNAIFMGILMFVFISLWSAIFSTRPMIDGFTLGMMIWYLVISESIIFSDSRISDEISREVKSGTLAYSLNKPYNYVLFKYSQYLGRGIIRFVITFLVGAGITLIIIGPISLSIESLLSLIVIFFGISINFLSFMIIGLLAFWFEDTSSFYLIYTKIIFTLGGMLLPLEFYPRWLEIISSYLPFAAVTYYPSRLFVAFDWSLFFKAVALQILWLVILGIIIAIIYHNASKKVVIHGG